MFYFATERGRHALEDTTKRRDLARFLWNSVSPTWDFDDRYKEQLARRPVITVPAIAFDAGSDPFTEPPGDGSAYRDRFTGAYEHRVLTDVGHNLPQEAPSAFAQAIVEAGRL
jgi:pimeloyl-ACP methyl ester carboxylesterase